MLGGKLFNPDNKKIDLKLCVGAFCFGLGWGIGGLCPGPAIMQFSVFTLQIQVVWFGCMVLGMYLAKFSDKFFDSEKKSVEKLELKENVMIDEQSPNLLNTQESAR